MLLQSKKGSWSLTIFFCDDYGLKILYEERVQGTKEEIEYDFYQLHLDYIHTKLHKSCGYFLDVDDWTARFVEENINRFFQAGGL